MGFTAADVRKDKKRAKKLGKKMNMSNPDGYSGTFRWARGTKFPDLPALGPRQQLDKYAYSFGWKKYLIERGGGDLTLHDQALSSPCMVDALSFSVTIQMAMKELGLPAPGHAHGTFNVIIAGATEWAEQRVAIESNYFDELSQMHPSGRLIVLFVGPEVRQTHTRERALPANLEMRFRRSGVRDFLLGDPGLKEVGWRDNSLVVVFNGGFGSFLDETRAGVRLLQSWLPDLAFLGATGLPVVYTGANETPDMMGEAHTHMVLGSIFLEGPRTNRFPMATTFVDQSVAQQAEGNVEEAFSQGNYFWYAVRGIDRTRQTVINMKSAEWYKLQFLPALKRAEQHLHDSGGDLNAPRPPPKDSNVSISSTGGKPTLPSKQPPLSHPTPTADKVNNKGAVRAKQEATGGAREGRGAGDGDGGEHVDKLAQGLGSMGLRDVGGAVRKGEEEEEEEEEEVRLDPLVMETKEEVGEEGWTVLTLKLHADVTSMDDVELLEGGIGGATFVQVSAAARLKKAGFEKTVGAPFVELLPKWRRKSNELVLRYKLREGQTG